MSEVSLLTDAYKMDRIHKLLGDIRKALQKKRYPFFILWILWKQHLLPRTLMSKAYFFPSYGNGELIIIQICKPRTFSANHMAVLRITSIKRNNLLWQCLHLRVP